MRGRVVSLSVDWHFVDVVFALGETEILDRRKHGSVYNKERLARPCHPRRELFRLPVFKIRTSQVRKLSFDIVLLGPRYALVPIEIIVILFDDLIA